MKVFSVDRLAGGDESLSTVRRRGVLAVFVAVAMVVSLAGVTVAQTQSPRGSDTFDDVPVGHWADEKIGWAVANGITRGVGEGRFGLEGIVTRAQMFTLLHRTINLLDDVQVTALGSDLFDDVPVGHWADAAIGWAVSNGIVGGVGEGTFDLEGTVSRAEMVTFLHRTVNLIQGRPVTTTTRPEGAILFTNDQDGDEEIFVVNADGSVVNADGTSVRQLTNNTYHDARPSWSPDGTKIAFDSNRAGVGADIFVMNADGTNVRRLTNSTYDDARPSWSPDGTKIAFDSNRAGVGADIFVMNADGTNVRRLTNHPRYDEAPSWSPDGTKIAFASDRDGDLEIFVMNADGTNVRQLTNNTHFDWASSWSPDGTKIAFTSSRGSGWQVVVVNADGTNEHQLTLDLSNHGHPSWSPDGTKIAFQSDQGHGNFEIYTMNADGTDRRRITNNKAHDLLSSRAWSSHSFGGGSDFFDDVPREHEADREIGWAFIKGITSGVGEGLFGPDGTITRAQIVTFLYRTVNLLEDTTGAQSPDTDSGAGTVRMGIYPCCADTSLWQIPIEKGWIDDLGITITPEGGQIFDALRTLQQALKTTTTP